MIDEAWIPCIGQDGRRIDHGIRDCLVQAHMLREICDDSPLVTVAIHRLLLAILYRAYNGPQEFAGWTAIYTNGSFRSNVIDPYLDAWRDYFNLLGGVRPFYQMEELETRKPVHIQRLATECASGNNATLFDHSGNATGVSWTYGQAARGLVACQSFALGFGKSGYARINGIEEELPYSRDSIALRGMNIWLQGANLFETLCINLVPVEDDSVPPWELDNPNMHRDRLEGKERKVVSAFGVVDRMTWQGRLIRLVEHDGQIAQMYYTQGRSADKSDSDPMKCYRASKKEGTMPLPLSANKAAWRDIHSVLMIPAAHSRERRPESLNLVTQARDAGIVDVAKTFGMNVVGLATERGKAGKFLLWRHERMPVDASVITDESLLERLGTLVRSAEAAADELKSRMKRLCRLFLSPDCESSGGGKPDPKEVARLADVIDSRPVFWARLEKHFYLLLESLPTSRDTASDIWCGHIKREAQRALEESVRMLGTSARAIQAIARVHRVFTDADLSPSVEKARNAGRKEGVNK